MDSTYDYKTEQTATLTGQEEEEDVSVKDILALFCDILTFELF